MKTSTIVGLALIGLGIYLYVKNKPTTEAKGSSESEPKANATGFPIPQSSGKILTPLGKL